MRVLLVALGRMGQRYAAVLREEHGADLELTTVDPKVAGGGDHFAQLGDVPANRAFDLAIDARPNEGRLDVLRDLLGRGVPHIVVEKPSAASMAESQAMLDVVDALAEPPRILVAFSRRYAPMYRRDVLSGLDAGALRSITISAGAVGLGCNGVHFLDLANALFDATPTEVFGRIDATTIPSPRGAQFEDLGGALLATYPAGRLAFQLDPSSGAGIQVSLVYEHGKIQVLEQVPPTWQWFRRTNEARELPWTRTHQEREVPVPHGCDLDVPSWIRRALRDLLVGRPVPGLRESHAALKVIAMAIASDRLGRPLTWDDDAAIADVTFRFT